MNFFQAWLMWFVGRPPDADEAVHKHVRAAVHASRNLAQNAVSVAHFSTRYSNQITEAANQAIARIEAARETTKCDD